MSRQKVVGKLERRIKLDENRRNGKFLERKEAKQSKNFNFLATLDYSDPRTQVFLMLLLSANVTGAYANRSHQPGSQSLTSTSTLFTDSTMPNTHNATNMVTNALPSSDISIQNVRNPAPVTFFSHQFATARMSVRESFSSFSSEEKKVCLVPSRDQVTKPFLSILPDLMKRDFKAVVRKTPIIDDINTLYTKFTLINGGSENKIYLATDKDGNEIIVRVSNVGTRMKAPSINLIAYSKLIKTREFSSYIPEIFAAYYAKSTNFSGLYTNPGDFVFCMEMEFIPKDYESLYYINRTNQPMEPRTIFEEVLGDYVVQKVAKCNINDLDGDVLRHHLYREDKNPVCYRIGDDIYLFPAGISPHKVDYDSFESFSGIGKDYPFRIGQRSFLFDHASEEMKGFLNDINQKGFFKSIKLHFSELLISEEELKNYPNIKCFNLTELANLELQQSMQPEASANQLKI